MQMPFRVASLSFNGGTTVSTADADIVAVVGPNNSGKTRTLQESIQLLAQPTPHRRPDASRVVLDDLDIVSFMTGEQLREWFVTNRHTWVSDGELLTHSFSSQVEGPLNLARMAFTELLSTKGLGWPLTGHLVHLMRLDGRLGYLGSPGRIYPGQPIEHPIQLLVADQSRRDLFVRAIRSAFKQNVILNQWAHNIQLHLSTSEQQRDFAFESEEGMLDEATAARLNALPLLETQGDGVRSFAGVVLSLLGTPSPLVLIDEPEAFLHPPQARLLGRYLGALRQGGQLFVATHSLDVLLGLLEADAKVQIVRLHRAGQRTTATTVEPDYIRALWNDPLLRFSRVLDGLFHEAVVVCEGDTDSRLYNAVAVHLSAVDASNTNEEGDPPLANVLRDALGENAYDVMFVHAGSKHRMSLIANALRPADVPVHLIADFDVLNDEHILRRLVESLGGQFSGAMKRDLSAVDAGLRGSSPKLRVQAVRDEIEVVLGVADPEAELSATMSSEIRRILDNRPGWPAAKKRGAAEVPPGDATNALHRLLKGLADIGLFVVPTGEVESFVKAVGKKGPAWVSAVIEQGRIADAYEAHHFVRTVLASLQEPAS
jgi:hypothetical protein